jgi:hypothetical protein
MHAIPYQHRTDIPEITLKPDIRRHNETDQM